MADTSIDFILAAENQLTPELVAAEKSFNQFQKTLESERKSLERYRISVEEGEEALYAYDLQMKGLDETTAKMITRQRFALKEMEALKKEAAKPIPQGKTPEGPSAGKATKTTTEFIGTLANLTGSSELGQFASQLGNLSEKSEQFAEAGKKGGAGALAFKAGLVAAVAAIAVSAGKFLGDWIFETKRWAEELENAKNKARELEQQAAKMRDLRFGDTTADIELIRDPEQKQQAYEKLLSDLKKNVSGVSSQVKSSQKAVDEWAETWQITGDRKGFAEQAKLQLEQDKERLAQLKEQQQQIERLLGVEKERAAIQAENAKLDASENYVESLREQLRLLKATGDEQRNIQAEQAGAVGADVGEASMLLAEIDAQNALLAKEKELEAERKRIADESINQQKKIEELKSSELAKLEEERVALERGKEAAHAFRLEKQGLAKADAERIAMMQAELEKELETKAQREQAQKAFETASRQPLQAQTSRFLTRGPTDDKTSKLVDLSKSQLEANKQAAMALDKLVRIQEDNKPKETLKLVGVS
jgi:hypothetical protein